eukprot:11625287-Heterocapsa_arctica.AAC.1
MTFRFGQCERETFKDITEEEPTYYEWAKQQKRPGKYLLEYIEWVDARYDPDVKNTDRRRRCPGRI